MLPLDAELPSLDTQKRVISAFLNSIMLQNMLMGIYTIVYSGTIYLYSLNKTSNASRRMVQSTLTVLYILCLGDILVDWYYLDWTIVALGDTRYSMFLSSLDAPIRVVIPIDLFFNATFVVSDWVLIWRCYHVWGRSVRIVAALFLFLLAEIALAISFTILEASDGQLQNNGNGQLTNNISGAFVLISAGTTVITTLLIAVRISYNPQIMTIIESSAVYSLILLLYGVIVICPFFNLIDSPLIEVQYYVQQVLTVIACMSPTVMVARLAVTTSRTAGTESTPTITNTSSMRFNDSQSRIRQSRSMRASENYPTTPVDKNSDDIEVPVTIRRSDDIEINNEQS
uniref:Uncharacterized protein n=1 Tax=Psilocybe cubensis TaxID=181762 RepID=A0A8H7XJ07_PSICU